MNTSTPCTELLVALLDARLAFPPIPRTCEAWSPKSKKTYLYADLNGIIDATVPVLGAHGLLLVQSIEDGDTGTLRLTSTLFHVATGQWIRSKVSVTRPENMQDYGAACTYLKRYAQQALLNISTEEDDDVASLDGSNKAETSTAAENLRPIVPVNGNGHHTPAPESDASAEHPTEGHIAALANLALTECREDKEVYYQRIRQTMGLKPQASVAPKLLTRTMSMAQYMTLFEYYRRLEAQLAKSQKEAPDGAQSGPAQASASPLSPATAAEVPQDPPAGSAGELSSAPEPEPGDTVESLVAYAMSLGLQEDVTRRIIRLHRDLGKCRKIFTEAAERNKRQVV